MDISDGEDKLNRLIKIWIGIMKIVILLPQVNWNVSGGSKVILEYANQMVQHGHSVSVYYLYGHSFQNFHLPEFLRKLAVRVLVKCIGCGHWFQLDPSIKENLVDDAMNMGDVDIVIATAIETAIELNSAKLSGCKKVYFIQGFENWSYSDETVYESYNCGMTNIVVAKWLKEIVDVHSDRPSYLVSNCINTEIFKNIGLDRKRHSIVFHYRSAAYKGAQYAIEVVRRLEQEYKDLSVEVISIEEAPDNLPESCTFHHAVSAEKIAEINNKTEVFMCTSIEEGFGLPGLEAMACGCAVASSSYRGVLEYAVDGENALLSPVRNVDAMVTNIIKLFEDENLRRKIVENGIKTGMERSLEKSAGEFEKILLYSTTARGTV